MSVQREKTLNLFAFFSLMAFQLILLAAMVYDNRARPAVVFFYVVVLLLMVPGYLAIADKSDFAGPIRRLVSRANLVNLSAFLAGAVLTYYGAHFLPVEPPLQVVIAGSAVGLAGCLFQVWGRPAYAHLPIVIYTGVFVGMSQVSRLGSGFELLLLAALIGGLYFLICPNIENGVGGKVGTIAFAGVLLVVVSAGNVGTVDVADAGAWMLVTAMGVGAVAAAGTYLFAHTVGVVASSTLISLVVAVVFRFVPPIMENGIDIAAAIPVIVIGASFAGMSAKIMIHDIEHVLLAGILFGVIFTTTFATPNHFFFGYGGALGTGTGLADIAVIGIIYLTDRIRTGPAQPEPR